jgi:hypothetical protein
MKEIDRQTEAAALNLSKKPLRQLHAHSTLIP